MLVHFQTKTVDDLKFLIKSSKNPAYSDRWCELLTKMKAKS
jgi:hypothetical protein